MGAYARKDQRAFVGRQAKAVVAGTARAERVSRRLKPVRVILSVGFGLVEKQGRMKFKIRLLIRHSTSVLQIVYF